MNPSKLNKRLAFYNKSIVNGDEQQTLQFTVWGSRIIRTKRQLNEQNEETYDFLIRSNASITPYMLLLVDNTWYDVFTVEPYEKERGFLLVHCEKAKINNFYDTVTVSRLGWTETEWGESVQSVSAVYTSIPCQLIKINSSTIDQTEQQLDIKIKYVLQLETKYNIQIGDKLEITHKQDVYNAIVDDYFRNHTFQEITIRMEGEA